MVIVLMMIMPCCLIKYSFTFIHILEILSEAATILVIKWIFIPRLASVILSWYGLGINKITYPSHFGWGGGFSIVRHLAVHLWLPTIFFLQSKNLVLASIVTFEVLNDNDLVEVLDTDLWLPPIRHSHLW